MRVNKRLIYIACGAMLSAILTAFAALADDACPDGTLGVSRTVEIDTTGGPWLGEPNGNRDFLANGEVVLTFDDGPSPISTPPILAALQKECTKATFFVVGSMVASHPETLKQVVAQGHTIGTHTWSHPNLPALSLAHATQEIESTFNEVEKVSPNTVAPFFRYPYLNSRKDIIDYLHGRNIAQFAIDVDSLDWLYHDNKTMIRKVMTGLKARGRGIILLHDIHKSTATALPELLSQIKAAGFKVVHMKPKSAPVLVAEAAPPAPQVQARPVAHRYKQQRTAMRSSRKAVTTDNPFNIW